MRALFESVRPSSVQERLDAYAAFLANRDGKPDFERGTLSMREASTAAFENTSLRYDGPFAVSTFDEQYLRHDRRRVTPPEVALLLVFVKMNANEAYAVEKVTRPGKKEDNSTTQIQRLVLLEETYHTRLLVSAAKLFGVQVPGPSRPTLVTRAIVTAIARMPKPLSLPVTLGGEALGIVTLLRILDAVRRVFKEHALIRDSLEERVTEVLIDEVGHLSLNRLLASAGTYVALRSILPMLALGTRGALPEAEALGILPITAEDLFSLDVRKLPEQVRSRAFIA